MLLAAHQDATAQTCPAPTGLTLTGSINNSAVLKWMAVPSAISYTVQWKPAAGISWNTAPNIAGTTYALPGLTAGMNYSFRVSSNCAATSSAYSSDFSFATICPAPAGLSATDAVGGGALLQWMGVPSAANYTVQWRLTAGSSWTTVPDIAGTAYTLPAATAGTNYSFKVLSNCGGASVYSSELPFSICAAAAPAGLSVTGLSGTSATLNWIPTPNTNYYTLQWKSATASNWTTIPNITGTSYTFYALTPETGYSYRVWNNCWGSPYLCSSELAFTTLERGVYNIPVVVHVLYNTSNAPLSNISDAQIQSQIDVLNQDFQLLNADAANVPAAFAPLKANCKVHFNLAKQDPLGNPTTGIIHKSTTKTLFSQSLNDAKFSAQGGDDAWPSDQYLNIWVVASMVLDQKQDKGYAQAPGGAAATDGIAMYCSSFGTVGSVNPDSKGHTATHLVGHWLNLQHLWGPGPGNPTCTATDSVTDTPPQSGPSSISYPFTAPAFPHTSCGNGPNGDLFMNFMDWTADASRCMFTEGQKARMWAVLAPGGARASLASSKGGIPAKTHTIPVVVHVLYYPGDLSTNISDAQVQSQIDILNQDFGLLNADAVNVPAAFGHLKTDCGIHFSLAKRDPQGNVTNGVVHKGIGIPSSYQRTNNAKFTAQGGDDAWPSDQYLNIWVVPHLTYSGTPDKGGNGYAQFPGGTAATDGVLIGYWAFAPYTKGRTATHMVGHWLNLQHLWGPGANDPTCTATDSVSDTPPQAGPNNGACPGFPHTSCANSPNGDLFVNFMDNTNDDCMVMFTQGQSARMRAVLATGGARASLASSQACTPAIKYTIPVVVHALYYSGDLSTNVSDAQIQSQIDVLNQDFGLLNAGVANMPAAFGHLKADCGIQFVLAKRDPQGNATNGILHKGINIPTFYQSSNNAKFSLQGGDDAWPSDQYLNIWTIPNLVYSTPDKGGIGWAQFPGGSATTDGVVVGYWEFGNRHSTTHLVGHWLNLYHPWGSGTSNPTCTGTDSVNDTPPQAGPNAGCAAFPHISCANGPNGDLFMNFMDYTDDACTYMFTKDQSTRMRAVLAPDGARASIANSQAGNAPVPCSAPAGLIVNDITSTSATLKWNFSFASSYTLQWKPTTGSTWTTVANIVGTTYTLTALIPGTAYSFKVLSDCKPCPNPSQMVVYIPTGNITSYWNSVPSASSYTFQWTPAPGSTWNTVPNILDSAYVALMTGDFGYRVSSNCPATASAYSSEFTFTTSCLDNFEPNESLGAARQIPVNIPVAATIGTGTDKDYYRFTTSSNAPKIKVLLTNVPADYDLKLYSSNGALLSSSNNTGTTAESVVYNTSYSGTYYVQVSGNNGANSGNCYNLMVQTSSMFGFKGANVPNTNLSGKFTLYPNPTRGEVSFEYDSKAATIAIITVIDQSGRTCKTIQLKLAAGQNKPVFDISDLSKGLYFVRMVANEETLTTKLFLER